MRDSRWGWYLPTNTEKMNEACWGIVRAVPPAAVMYHIGEGVTSEDIRTILEEISPDCHVIFRWWCPPRTTSVQDQIDKLVETVSNPTWNGLIPVGQRWVQFGNEPNTEDGSEGYGCTEGDMERFNADYLSMHEQVRAANPDWGIGFTPMAPGNRDAFFPHSEDPENVTYFFHGPEMAHPNPTAGEIEAAILSGPCYESLRRADALFAHIYSINDPENEKFAPWCGLRWLVQQRLLPNPTAPVFINELGIRGIDHLTSYHDYLIANHPLVLGTCQYKLRDEPWNFYGSEPNINPAVVIARNWFLSLPEVDPEPPPEPPPPEEEQMRAFVGIHYTNDHNSTAEARQAFGAAKFEAVKVFNFTNVAEADFLRQINPDTRFLCRLWSGRFGPGHVRPSPQQFIEDVEIGLGVWLNKGCDHFEIHNEPNEREGKEGFGDSEADAIDFQNWYLLVLSGLKGLFPTALFGFPGLCPHANDVLWLDWCREAISASDFLCVHSYWQGANHLHPDWGLRYHRYLDRYPATTVEITEWGSSDSTVSWEEKADQYVAWLKTTMEEPLIRGTYSFILQSPDWEHFAWVDNEGNNRPMVAAVSVMDRPPLHGEPDPDPEPPPDPDPIPPDLCEEARNTTDAELVCIVAADFHNVLFFYHLPEHGGWPIGKPNQQRAVICRWIQTPGFQNEYGDWLTYMRWWDCREAPPSPPPIANFTADLVMGEAPLPVAFTDMSQGETGQWRWTFGDGHFSTAQNPSHIYVTPGNYTVSLTVTGPGGTDTLQRVGYIQASQPSPQPDADFIVHNGAGPVPLEVWFENTTTGLVDSWEWNFGDGVASILKHPIHTYLKPGSYSVTLSAVGPGGTSIKLVPSAVVVTEKPEPPPDHEYMVSENPRIEGKADFFLDNKFAFTLDLELCNGWSYNDGLLSIWFSSEVPNVDWPEGVHIADFEVLLDAPWTVAFLNYIYGTAPEPPPDIDPPPDVDPPIDIQPPSQDQVRQWAWDSLDIEMDEGFAEYARQEMLGRPLRNRFAVAPNAWQACFLQLFEFGIVYQVGDGVIQHTEY